MADNMLRHNKVLNHANNVLDLIGLHAVSLTESSSAALLITVCERVSSKCSSLSFALGCILCPAELLEIQGDKEVSLSGTSLCPRNFFTWVEFLLY